MEKARKLKVDLMKEKIQIARKMQESFEPKEFLVGSSPNQGKIRMVKTRVPNKNVVLKGNPEIKYYKNGRPKLPPKRRYRWHTEPTCTIEVPTKIGVKLTMFNPGSRAHIVRWLKEEYGWKPEVFTAKGNPKVGYDTLESLTYPETDDLKRYLKIVKDLGSLYDGDGSLMKLVDPKTGRLHGRVMTCRYARS